MGKRHPIPGARILITGASQGIGRALAEEAARRGALVLAAARSSDQLAELAERVRAGGGKLEVVTADVTNPQDRQQMVKAATHHFGGLDILVNNAGIGIFADVASMTPEQWSDVIDTNLTGVFYACRAAIPHLRARGNGFIINISSLAGKNPFADGAAYCATKAGLNAFSESLMQELRYDGIRVSYVLPGSVATAFSSGDAAKGAEWKIAAEEVAEVVVNLLRHDPRSLPSRVELRPSKPPKK